MTADSENQLTIVRVFDAPREAVWNACREAEALREWWGMPNGVVMPFCKLDFRVGGSLHFGTQRPGNPMIWFKCDYLEIVEGEKLVMVQHRSDQDGTARDSAEWPASTITLRLEDLDGKTKLTVVHSGMASGRATVDDYRQGWSETLDRLTAILPHG